MLENLALLDLASAMARHAAARHRVIAENVANADTPGYRARDVEDFRSAVNKVSPDPIFVPKAARPGHADAGSTAAAVRTRLLALPATSDGNTVSLEDQAVRAVQAQGDHALATAVYAKAIDILRLGLGRLR